MITVKSSSKNNPALVIIFAMCLIASIAMEWGVRDCRFIQTSDSRQYLSAANSFKESKTFICEDGSYYTNWAPLFPIILSAFDKPEKALIWINVFCKIIIGVVIFYLVDHFLRVHIVKVLVFLIVFLSTHFLFISVFLYAELLFMMLLFLHLYFTLNLKNSRYYYFLWILSGFLLCVQRNAGLFWILGTAAWMLFEKGQPWRKNLTLCILYITLCTSGLWVWNFYNALNLTHDAPFYQRAFFADAFVNAQLMLSCVGKFFSPLRGSLSIAVGALLVAGIFYWVLKRAITDRSLQLLMVAVTFYILGFMPVPNLDIYDMERYFAVIMPLFTIILFVAVENLCLRYTKFSNVIIISALLWSTYPIVRMCKNAVLWRDMSCRGVSVK